MEFVAAKGRSATFADRSAGREVVRGAQMMVRLAKILVQRVMVELMCSDLEHTYQGWRGERALIVNLYAIRYASQLRHLRAQCM